MRLLRAKELRGRHLHLQKRVPPLRYDILRGNLMVARIQVSLEDWPILYRTEIQQYIFCKVAKLAKGKKV
jgi:hypothetical protein